ncbi:unnamed protein product, partial [Rotaria magnacalcarata]
MERDDNVCERGITIRGFMKRGDFAHHRGFMKRAEKILST